MEPPSVTGRKEASADQETAMAGNAEQAWRGGSRPKDTAVRKVMA